MRLSRKRWAVIAVAGLAFVCVASIVATKLALFAGFLVLVVWLSLPADLAAKTRSRLRALLWISATAAAIGSVRFIATEAVPGIVQAGNRTTSRKAVSRLRELLFVQDAMRRHAYLDPDGDGIGSAATILELAGLAKLRGKALLEPPPLDWPHASVEHTPKGAALLEAGYLFMVCLPTLDASWTANAEGNIDEEAAERRFVAHAWPARVSQHLTEAFTIDEHERISVSENKRQGHLLYVGPLAPPPCEASRSASEHGPLYRNWKGKAPRRVLPYDGETVE